jgi:hypothetical protein
MATFFVLNHKKYRTSVRCADGRLEAVRFEPEVYFGGVGESTYTTSDPAIIDALHEHPAYQVTFWEKATITTAPIEETTPGNPATDLETLLSDPATATRGNVSSGSAGMVTGQPRLCGARRYEERRHQDRSGQTQHSFY